jgi:glutamate synthase domain-containing protein 1
MQKEGELRIPSGCAISGMFSKEGKLFNGEQIIQSIEIMHDRSNGLGGGFAAYGIYPGYREHYALHVFFDDRAAKENCEVFLQEHFEIAEFSEIPTKRVAGVNNPPLIWRYFVTPLNAKLDSSQLDEKEYTVQCVFSINLHIAGAFVFSSGKNMGVFKAVGFPEDVGRFYRLDEYEGYCFTAHGRYPTNTPGWWGGAHPFSLLDFTVVHNGEISSYDANRRSIEQYGYACTLLTDTEVITYILDFLHRKVRLTFEEIASIIAAPFWQVIDTMPEAERLRHEYLRHMFAAQLITGPFSILVGFRGGLMALNDRLKLRSMVVAEKDNMFYVASEESAIRVIEPDLDVIRAPRGGEAVIVTLNEGVAV